MTAPEANFCFPLLAVCLFHHVTALCSSGLEKKLPLTATFTIYDLSLSELLQPISLVRFGTALCCSSCRSQATIVARRQAAFVAARAR